MSATPVAQTYAEWVEAEADRHEHLAPNLWDLKSLVGGRYLPDGRREENLHPAIRTSALDYFGLPGKVRIHWHGSGWRPEASVLASQVSCVNHLMGARLDAEVALSLASAVIPDAVSVRKVDEGYAALEWSAPENWLGERGSGKIRGRYWTSLDGLLIVERPGNALEALIIEWKYTEPADAVQKWFTRRFRTNMETGDKEPTDEIATDRRKTYDAFVVNPASPFNPGVTIELLLWEPLYQLMRQTLLGWQLCLHGQLGVTAFHHIAVVPAGNTEQRGVLHAHPLEAEVGFDTRGLRIEVPVGLAWKRLLKEPKRFQTLTPSDLFSALTPPPKWHGWRSYLEERYDT